MSSAQTSRDSTKTGQAHLEYARPLRQWKADWPTSYHRLLAHLREQWPDGRGVKEFIRILQLHQHYPAAQIEQAIEQALSFGCPHLDGVKHCLTSLQSEPGGQFCLDLSDVNYIQPLDNYTGNRVCSVVREALGASYSEKMEPENLL